jgi:hypothetical protein
MLIQTIRRSLVLILATMTLGVALVFIIAWAALKPVHQKNGFSRKIVSDKPLKLYSVKKNSSIIGIAGATEHHLYFKTTDPTKLWITETNLQNGKLVTLSIPNNKRISSAFNIIVDSPIVHVMAGNGPAIIKTHLNNRITSVYRFPRTLFTRGVRLSPHTYAIRGFDTVNKRLSQVFLKGNPSTGEVIRKVRLSESDNIANLITDGYLNYDEQTHLLVYVSFYKNTIVCLDTNLNLVKSYCTIDTISSYKVAAGQIKKSITNAAPARIINSKIRTYGGKLFVISKLKADNEKDDEFIRNAVVDVYSLERDEYINSFYIPRLKAEKLLDYKIIKNTAVVVYENHVILYQISPDNNSVSLLRK